ncbi:MAG: flagellar hook capping FlgD N-terminal domain-containing protein [Pseudomonadota bacterium]
MDAVNSTTTPTNTSAQTNAHGSENEAAAALSSDFETFLRMLTVQMENQDPLNPIESSDFAVQLATFSGVEQQVRTNDLLESLLGQQSVSALSQVSGWVGMEGRAAVPVSFTGNPVAYYIQPSTGADQATLVVKDEAGREVSRSAISATATGGAWSGTDATGAALPEGNYTLGIEYRGNGELISTKNAEVYAEVTEARLVDGDPVIVFATGGEAKADEVSAVRSPVQIDE